MSALRQVRRDASKAKETSSDAQVQLLADCVLTLVIELEAARKTADEALKEARKNRPRFT